MKVSAQLIMQKPMPFPGKGDTRQATAEGWLLYLLGDKEIYPPPHSVVKVKQEGLVQGPGGWGG